MIYLQSGQVLYVRMGQGDTTLPPDCTVYYSKAITVNGRASETDRSVSQADTFDQVQKATTGITDLLMLSGPALPSNDPNVVATGQRYKCRVIIANRDSITRTAFVYVKTGSTDRYILAGLPIPAGHTAYSTIDGFFEVTEGGSLTAVTSSAVIADNRIVRGDGGARGIQDSGVTIDDTNDVTGMNTLTLPQAGLHILDTNASHDLILSNGTNMTADRTLNLIMTDANRQVAIYNDITANGTGSSVLGRSADTDGTMTDIVVTAGKFLGVLGVGNLLGPYYPTQVLSKSSAYPLVQRDYGATVLVTAAATITLPAPATVGSGWWCCIKKTVAVGSDVTIARNASETIDGRSASDVLKSQYAFAVYVTDGTNWHVLEANDYLVDRQTSATNFASSSTYADGATITIPPGEWDVSGIGVSLLNSSTTTVILFGVSNSTPTNSFSDRQDGDNAGTAPVPTDNSQRHITAIPAYRVSVATSTPYYLKALAAFSAGNPQYLCRISARRVG